KAGSYPAPYPSFQRKRRGRGARYLDGRAPQIVGRNSEAYSAKSLSPPRHQDTKLLISYWRLSVLVVQLSCFLDGKAPCHDATLRTNSGAMSWWTFRRDRSAASAPAAAPSLTLPRKRGEGRQSEALSGGGQRRRLARRRRADTACPFMTKRALMAIAEDAAATAPWWRIIKPDGAMMAYFPGGAATTGAATQGRGIDAK